VINAALLATARDAWIYMYPKFNIIFRFGLGTEYQKRRDTVYYSFATYCTDKIFCCMRHDVHILHVIELFKSFDCV